MYERTSKGRQRAGAHPLSDLLHYQPNLYQTAIEFWDMMIGHAALRGRAYAEIIPGARGFVDQLVPLHPDRIEVSFRRDGRPDYTYTESDGTKRPIAFEYMFTFAGPMDGVSVVSAARESFGLAKATEEHAARLFGQGIQISGVLEHPKRLDDATSKRIAESFAHAYGGVNNAHKPAVLEEGMKWQKMGLTAEDSQFIQSRKFQINEIARWFRVPPHMVGDLERATFSNIEHQGIEFVTHTLRPWLVRIEMAIRRDLIVAQGKFYAEFLVDALMRGDTKSRYDAYNVGIQSGILAPNEPRAWENLNPLDGLDEPLRPLNMTSVSQAIEDVPASQPTQSAQASRRTLDLLRVAATRVVNKESKAITRAAGKMGAEEFNTFVTDFYDDHAAYVAEQLCISHTKAIRLCETCRTEVLQVDQADVANLMTEWLTNDRIDQVVQYAAS
jgi:HK97 family phage portal protein